MSGRAAWVAVAGARALVRGCAGLAGVALLIAGATLVVSVLAGAELGLFVVGALTWFVVR